MGKWHSAVFGAIYNKTEDDSEKVEGKTETLTKEEKSGKSKWQESILNAIYGDTSKETEEATPSVAKDQPADPVLLGEKIFAKAESKRNSVLGVLGSFTGGGE